MTVLAGTSGLSRRYAGLIAVDKVDLAVSEGTVHALIGPNGAGKTTLFDLISGLVRPTEGVVRLAGRDVTRLRPEERAALGLARTFQNIRPLGAMTVLENVLAGLHLRRRVGLAGTVLRSRRFRQEERALLARARAVLELVGLGSVEGEPAVVLSGGDQRRLEIARAVAAEPALLLLDEPAAGMNPAETAALAALVRRIRAGGTTVLLVEHDMGFVMDIADVVTVLNFGRVIFEGTPAAVRQEPAVMEAYLGHKMAARLARRAQAAPA